MKMEPAKENDPQKGFVVRSFLAAAEQPGGPTQYEPQPSYDLSFQPPSLIRQASTIVGTQSLSSTCKCHLASWSDSSNCSDVSNCCCLGSPQHD